MSSIIFLFAAPCFRVFGNDVLHGHLTLIGERLRFDQEGQQPEWIPGHAIMGLEISPQGLTILTSFGLLRFFAKDFRLQSVGSALKNIIHPVEDNTAAETQTYLFAKAYARIPSQRKSRTFGGIHLTDKHLIFYSVDASSHLHICLDKIIAVEKFRMLKKIKITTADIHFFLYGKVAEKTAGFLQALGFPTQDQSIVRSWHCWYSKMGIWLTSAFAITTNRQLHIIPLHSLFTLTPIRIQYSSIWQVEYNAKKLKIHLTNGSVFQLSLPKANLQTHRLFCENLCKSQEILFPNEESKTTAFLWLSTRKIQRGILELKSKVLQFQRNDPLQTTLEIPIEQLCRNDDGETPAEALPIKSNDKSLLFFPAKPNRFSRHLYKQVNPPYRIINWRTLTPKGKQSLLGERLAQVNLDNQVILVRLSFNKNLCLSAIRQNFSVNTPIEVEFSTTNGRYAFESSILEQINHEEWLLMSPTTIKMISQRSVERTAVDGMIHGMEIEFGENGWLPKPFLFSFSLIDISEKGCGLEGPPPANQDYYRPSDIAENPETGSRFLIDFTTPNQVCQVQAECIYMQPQPNGMYRYGMKFISQNAGMKAKMNRIIAIYKKQQIGSC